MVFDYNHLDPDEHVIDNRLSTIDPQKKIVFFKESRCLESESLNQYSLELLNSDNPLSTATSCMLLVGNMMMRKLPRYLKSVLSTIYADPSLKKLFTEKHYSKYDPNHYGLEKTREWKPLNEGNMSDREKTAIENVESLIQLLDKELPNISSFPERESFFADHMLAVTKVMTVPDGSFDHNIFDPISEALAFIKIKQVHSELDSNADKSREVSLSMINQLYGGTESSIDLLVDLNLDLRTQFQANKVIKIVEKILNGENSDPDTIFVVRVGAFHRDVLTSELNQHYTYGDIREINLTKEDLPEVEQKIQDLFSSSMQSEVFECDCIIL